MNKKIQRKRKQSKKTVDTKIKLLKVIASVLLIIAVIFSSFVIWSYFDDKKAKEDLQKKENLQKSIEKKQENTKEQKKEPQEPLDTSLKPSVTKENSEDYKKDSSFENLKNEIKNKITKPKLAIIIDDVVSKQQIKNINNIGYTINMSFLPPTKNYGNSANIVNGLPFYMVHFPMEAVVFKKEEENTLYVGDSYEKIENTVRKIRELYPGATFVNNHTGSKFTADHDGMDKLFRALKKYNFNFLDSKTTPQTVSKKYAQKYQVLLLERNVFLDNKQEYNYILRQLKESISHAKKNGYAIAIGHPYKITIEVLKDAKDLLKDLDLVYINSISQE